MESASCTLSKEPAGGATAGVNWARDEHAISVVNARGREVARHTVEHTTPGLRDLLAVLARTGAGEVAIERPDGPVFDVLLDAGITVVVISPNQVKNPHTHLRDVFSGAVGLFADIDSEISLKSLSRFDC